LVSFFFHPVEHYFETGCEYFSKLNLAGKSVEEVECLYGSDFQLLVEKVFAVLSSQAFLDADDVSAKVLKL